ncbi:hypothetical protein BC826DRAFT_974959, partial [Russula brevipes]
RKADLELAEARKAEKAARSYDNFLNVEVDEEEGTKQKYSSFPVIVLSQASTGVRPLAGTGKVKSVSSEGGSSGKRTEHEKERITPRLLRAELRTVAQKPSALLVSVIPHRLALDLCTSKRCTRQVQTREGVARELELELLQAYTQTDTPRLAAQRFSAPALLATRECEGMLAASRRIYCKVSIIKRQRGTKTQERNNEVRTPLHVVARSLPLDVPTTTNVCLVHVSVERSVDADQSWVTASLEDMVYFYHYEHLKLSGLSWFEVNRADDRLCIVDIPPSKVLEVLLGWHIKGPSLFEPCTGLGSDGFRYFLWRWVVTILRILLQLEFSRTHRKERRTRIPTACGATIRVCV